MKIEVDEDGGLVLKHVYNGVMFVTDEGQRLSVCMRDGGFAVGLFQSILKPGESARLRGPEWIQIDDGKIIKD